MDSTKRRLIGVAVTVCGFAVGMAGLLNFFKYRAAAEKILTERLVVTGRSVENSVQGSLSLGVQFNEITTMTTILERERSTDDLIVGIDVFDMEGRMLYSTDRLRANRPAPVAWVAAAKAAGNGDWRAEENHEAAAGIALRNNFNLTIGYIALRYNVDRVREAAYSVAGELALQAGLIFAGSAALASLALLWVLNGLGRSLHAVEQGLGQGDAIKTSTRLMTGPFGAALRRFVDTTRRAEAEIASLRSGLGRGGPQ